MARLLLRHLRIAAVTAVLLLAIAWLGQVPFGRATGRATVRLALRTATSKVEVCRDLSAAELEALPAHMRQPRECRQMAPPYRLRVALDQRRVLEEQFRPGGLRGDRPLIVDRWLVHPPGAVRLQVDFEPVLDAAAGAELIASGAALPSYRLDRRIRLAAERITLVQLDEATGRLEIFDDPGAPLRPGEPR